MANRFAQDTIESFREEIGRMRRQRDEVEERLFKCRAALKASQERLLIEIELREKAEAELKKLKGGADV